MILWSNFCYFYFHFNARSLRHLQIFVNCALLPALGRAFANVLIVTFLFNVQMRRHNKTGSIAASFPSAQNTHYARSYKSAISDNGLWPRHSLNVSLRHDRCHMHVAHRGSYCVSVASHFWISLTHFAYVKPGGGFAKPRCDTRHYTDCTNRDTRFSTPLRIAISSKSSTEKHYYFLFSVLWRKNFYITYEIWSKSSRNFLISRTTYPIESIFFLMLVHMSMTCVSIFSHTKCVVCFW